ncbi:MAG: TetR/AcrR family transcriptional regulator [Marinomonas sp.]|uniref:TetR/AcrR family transcriptional regulator n=1 Tax=Marinomonas sp. S3726 TaxID=579484 RepID=UPI000B2EFE70|nr:TetR/AcrR family transcriptional regulator [Marinomonas sp. S3726]
MIMKTPRKPSSNRVLLENRILRAAEKAFATKGFSGTSMESVADSAGISKQNLIYYFSSKEALYHKVLQVILDLWVEKMVFSDDEDASPKQVIESYIIEKLALSRDYPDASKVFAHEIINGAPVLKDYMVSHLKPQFERDVQLVKRWIAKGLIDPVEPEHLFFTIWASTQTYADFSIQIQLLMGKTKLEADDFDVAAKFLSNFVLKALGAQNE